MESAPVTISNDSSLPSLNLYERCTTCHEKIIAGRQFCVKCGTRVLGKHQRVLSEEKKYNPPQQGAQQGAQHSPKLQPLQSPQQLQQLQQQGVQHQNATPQLRVYIPHSNPTSSPSSPNNPHHTQHHQDQRPTHICRNVDIQLKKKQKNKKN